MLSRLKTTRKVVRGGKEVEKRVGEESKRRGEKRIPQTVLLEPLPLFLYLAVQSLRKDNATGRKERRSKVKPENRRGGGRGERRKRRKKRKRRKRKTTTRFSWWWGGNRGIFLSSP
eukprot:331242-Hanusia_phi.AAC.2